MFFSPAGRQALQRAAQHLESRTSFAIETTLSGHNYLRTMLDARQLGFDVVLIYVGTDSSDINVARVNNRVLLGGHHVPEEDIRRRYERSLANLELAVARTDHGLIFDNSTKDGFRLVAQFAQGEPQWLGDLPSWAAAPRPAERQSPRLSASLSPPSQSDSSGKIGQNRCRRKSFGRLTARAVQRPAFAFCEAFCRASCRTAKKAGFGLPSRSKSKG